MSITINLWVVGIALAFLAFALSSIIFLRSEKVWTAMLGAVLMFGSIVVPAIICARQDNVRHDYIRSIIRYQIKYDGHVYVAKELYQNQHYVEFIDTTTGEKIVHRGDYSVLRLPDAQPAK